MLQNRKIYRFILSAAFVVLVPFVICAQDLGSSNLLFKAANPKTKTAKTAPKKAAAKKPAPVKSKSASASTARKNVKTTAAKNAAAARRSVAANKKNSSKKVDKTETPVVADIKKVDSAVGESAKPTYDELFENAIEEGNNARDTREYIKAETAYLRAQSLATKDSRAIYGLGNLYSDQQRWDEAERAYRAAVQMEPTNADAYIALSFVLTQPVSDSSLAARYAEAERTAREAIKLDANNAVAYDQLGVALELRGIIDGETQRAYRKAIELDPNFALAYAHLGRLLRRKGLNNESAEAYRTAIKLAIDVPTMILVADVMQSQQRYLESEQLLRQALRQDPKNPTGLNLLGRALTTRGNYEEAEKVLKKGAEVSPNSFVSHSLLGSLFLRREKFDDAEEFLMKALKMASANEKKRLALDFEQVGDGFLRVGKIKDAARVFQQAALLDPGKPALADKLTRARNG